MQGLTLGMLFLLPLTAGSFARAQAAAKPSVGEQSTPVNDVAAKGEQQRDENYEFSHSPTVIKLGSVVGLNPDQASTAFTVLNFLVLVGLLGFALVKALPKAFRNRNTTIQKQLVDARSATEEASARLGSVEARLAKLDEQIAAMKAQAEADSARDEQRIKASVEEEKAKIIAAAEAEIQSASTLARRGLQKYAAELAIEQASKKLIVTAETDRLLVESFAHRLLDEKAGAN
jgi:F-type H+-transporting ATPase subunit b